MHDDYFMRRCLELAARGRGHVGNGAMVGAVLVRDGKIIAEGCHRGFGQAHAEAALFASFDGRVQSSDLLYVNLEPCCHQGKTPPCTALIIRRGVQCVVVGMIDPDSRMAGEGIRKLRAAGIDVSGPVLPELCARFNRGFLSLRAIGRPWITLKQATTRDGKISGSDGRPIKITSQEQDVWSHRSLRALHDAILVGVRTIVSDDPILNARFAQSAPPQLYRIILDPTLRIPMTSSVVTDENTGRTIIVTAAQDHPSRSILRDRGVRILDVALRDDLFEWPVLWRALTTPSGDFHGITSILVEGGARTWNAFREAGAIDEEVTLVGKD